MQNAVLDSWGAYNQRRYGCPWVCVMRADGSYNFEPRIGTYTGNARQGEGGDLVVFEPVVGQVYGYGQKDYRSSRSMVCYGLPSRKPIRADGSRRPGTSTVLPGANSRRHTWAAAMSLSPVGTAPPS